MNAKLNNRRADSIVEYVIVLGLLLGVLVGMELYIKRGVQAKVKDLADNFISSEQVADTSPKSIERVAAETRQVEDGITHYEDGALVSGSFKTSGAIVLSSTTDFGDEPYDPGLIWGATAAVPGPTQRTDINGETTDDPQGQLGGMANDMGANIDFTINEVNTDEGDDETNADVSTTDRQIEALGGLSTQQNGSGE